VLLAIEYHTFKNPKDQKQLPEPTKNSFVSTITKLSGDTLELDNRVRYIRFTPGETSKGLCEQ
jgi:hypothetical protein